MRVDELGVKGVVRVVATNVRTGEVQEVTTENVITNAGADLLRQAWLTGKYVAKRLNPASSPACPNDIGYYVRPYWALVLGTGSGTPDVSDTDLFQAVPESARGKGQDGAAISITHDQSGWHVDITPFPYGSDADLTYLDGTGGVRGFQYHARYMPEELNGYTFTEVGIYENIPPKWYQVGDYSYAEYYIPPDRYTAGVLFEHALLPQSIEKTPDIMLDVYVTIKILP